MKFKLKDIIQTPFRKFNSFTQIGLFLGALVAIGCSNSEYNSYRTLKPYELEYLNRVEKRNKEEELKKNKRTFTHGITGRIVENSKMFAGIGSLPEKTYQESTEYPYDFRKDKKNREYMGEPNSI